jgi:hypothetical protein
VAITYTQAQIDAFKAALLDRSGAQQVTFGDQSMTFASLEEAKKFLAYMERNLTTNVSTSRTRYAAFTKGV